MTARDDIPTAEPIGYLKPEGHWTEEPKFVRAQAWRDHSWMQAVFTIPVYGEPPRPAPHEADRDRAAEEERIREDERRSERIGAAVQSIKAAEEVKHSREDDPVAWRYRSFFNGQPLYWQTTTERWEADRAREKGCEVEPLFARAALRSTTTAEGEKRCG